MATGGRIPPYPMSDNNLGPQFPPTPPQITLDHIDPPTLARSILTMPIRVLQAYMNHESGWGGAALRILAETIDAEAPAAPGVPSAFDLKHIEQSRRLSCAKIATRLNQEGCSATALVKDAQEIYDWVQLGDHGEKPEVQS